MFLGTRYLTPYNLKGPTCLLPYNHTSTSCLKSSKCRKKSLWGRVVSHGFCLHLFNEEHHAAFLMLHGETEKTFSFPLRHRLTCPFQIALNYVILFLCVSGFCSHCQQTTVAESGILQGSCEQFWSFGSTQCWFVSTSYTPLSTPFGMSPSGPGG